MGNPILKFVFSTFLLLLCSFIIFEKDYFAITTYLLIEFTYDGIYILYSKLKCLKYRFIRFTLILFWRKCTFFLMQPNRPIENSISVVIIMLFVKKTFCFSWSRSWSNFALFSLHINRSFSTYELVVHQHKLFITRGRRNQTTSIYYKNLSIKIDWNL